MHHALRATTCRVPGNRRPAQKRHPPITRSRRGPRRRAVGIRGNPRARNRHVDVGRARIHRQGHRTHGDRGGREISVGHRRRLLGLMPGAIPCAPQGKPRTLSAGVARPHGRAGRVDPGVGPDQRPSPTRPLPPVHGRRTLFPRGRRGGTYDRRRSRDRGRSRGTRSSVPCGVATRRWERVREGSLGGRGPSRRLCVSTDGTPRGRGARGRTTCTPSPVAPRHRDAARHRRWRGHLGGCRSHRFDEDLAAPLSLGGRRRPSHRARSLDAMEGLSRRISVSKGAGRARDREIPVRADVSKRAAEIEAIEPTLEGRAEAILSTLPPSYLDSAPIENLADEVLMLSKALGPGEIRTKVSDDLPGSHFLLTVCVPDRPGPWRGPPASSLSIASRFNRHKPSPRVRGRHSSVSF